MTQHAYMSASLLRRALVVIALVAGVAAMIIAGNRAGHELAHRREQSEIARRLSRADSGESSALRAGDPFPGVELIAETDSTGVAAHIDSRALIAGREALVLFLSSNCEPCTESVQRWSQSVEDLPDNVLLFGVIDCTPEERRAYVLANDVTFPVLSDSADVYGREHEMEVFPTVVAVDASGSMVFVRHGIDEGFTPSVALEFLRVGIDKGD